MSLNQTRVRLARLERLAQSDDVKVENKKLSLESPIDPELVKAITDEYDFIEEVFTSRAGRWRGPLATDPETPEEIQARARIAELAKTIGCPPCYGFVEYWKDDTRLHEKIDDNEKAQVKVRMEIFWHSPEGQARIRLDRLENGPGLIDPAGFKEIERLLKLYPEPWANPTNTGHVSWLIQKRGKLADRKRRAEKHQHRIKQRDELGRSSRTKPSIGNLLYAPPAIARYFELLRKTESLPAKTASHIIGLSACSSRNH